MLVQVGGTMGDKYLEGKIPNMRYGEYRYYPQDNLNIIDSEVREISKKVFQRILTCCFPDYMIDPDPDDGDLVGSVGKLELSSSGKAYYHPLVINKGYICFKESTPEETGTLLYIHNGYILAYKERHLFSKNNMAK